MAVWRMLGDGPLARRRFKNLKVYSGLSTGITRRSRLL
ncbi:putative ribosomal protein L13 [Anaplasma phagocytophilum str. ApNP]|uniref:Putative ribosomal protein L13 n=1 Tax=Anaplasma phagocytophilum str. ApNP TaxID=1359153 RepID=A0A0F3NGZ0_ANAPH|nr:putative ribosomal protein L13 [Anaplasma phagocytophilum str. ApNP]